jgi:hypothetical protein
MGEIPFAMKAATRQVNGGEFIVQILTTGGEWGPRGGPGPGLQFHSPLADTRDGCESRSLPVYRRTAPRRLRFWE